MSVTQKRKVNTGVSGSVFHTPIPTYLWIHIVETKKMLLIKAEINNLEEDNNYMDVFLSLGKNAFVINQHLPEA